MNFKKQIAFCSIIFILLVTGSVVASEPPRPNILLILCDDLGYSDVGFNGAKDIQTPTLDALAKEGIIATSAYVPHPFCGPSRAGIMTGRYPHEIGAQFNLPPNSETIGKGIDLKETFISKILNNAGYYTGAIGKWHLGASPKYHPNKRGFDDFYGFLGGGHSYFPKQFKATYNKQKKEGKKIIWDYLHPLEHNGKLVDENQYITDGLSREAVRFINDASKKTAPFFLYLAYNAPHTPLEAKKEDLEHYTHIKDNQRKTYAAMVHAVDRGVSNIIKALKDSGQYANTLIVFLSDNGGKLSRGATNYPLRGEKGSTCEGGFRVPMLLHWANVLPAGKTYTHPISVLDFYPTFSKLAGATIPESKKIDGKDFWPNLLKNENAHKKDPIFVLRHGLRHSDVGVRKDKWKALKLNAHKWSLYDIEKDLGEENDLSAKYPKILEKMIFDAKVWSKKHQEPRWFHAKKAKTNWIEEQMPHFEQTFQYE